MPVAAVVEEISVENKMTLAVRIRNCNMTTFNEYQRAAVKVTVSRTTDHSPLQFPLLGLQEEVGKLASLLDISLTLNMDALTDDQTEEIRSRCGEMLWYLAHICRELNIDMEDIALRSLQELQNRAGSPAS